MDLKLDGNGDAIFSNGNTVVTKGAEENTAQRLYIMLRTFAGEWFLNVEHGIPYFQSILGQKTSKQAVDLIFQQKILAESGVQEIVEFTSSLQADRKYKMSFKVRANNAVVSVDNIELGV